MLILAVILNQLDFYWIVERRTGTYDRWGSSLSGLVTISAVLVFGPTAIWLVVITLVNAAKPKTRPAVAASQRRRLIVAIS